MSDDTTSIELYKLYLATAEKVSDRRAAANSWMLSVNSAIAVLYGYLAAEDATVGVVEKSIWLLAIPAAGILVSSSWAALLGSFSKLNSAKFDVLQEIERHFPLAPFTLEEEIYRDLELKGLSKVEKRVPYAFIALYAAMALASLATLIL